MRSVVSRPLHLTCVLYVMGCLAASAGWAADPESSTPPAQPSPPINAPTLQSPLPPSLQLFADVLERTRTNYIDPVTSDVLVENALKGMLSGLDPHSTYMNEQQYKQITEKLQGEFGGLGIEIALEKGLLRIIAPIDDTPAAQTPIAAGDILTHADGLPLDGMTMDDVVTLLRGNIGTTITLTLRKGGIDGAPYDVTITRQIIKIKAVKWDMKRANIGYLRIATFNDQSAPMLDAALADLATRAPDGMKGYVIDVRNNPGGGLKPAVAVTDRFLDVGKPIVAIRGRTPNETRRWQASRPDATNGKPLVVLINNGSASASEILAGALQDNERALVVGTRSFGKGSVQTLIPFPRSGGIRLTTARYYTPSGRSIQKQGVDPDIVIPNLRVEEQAETHVVREQDLPHALDMPRTTQTQRAPDPSNLNSQNTKTTNEKKAQKDTSSPLKQEKAEIKTDKNVPDYQLERALDLVEASALIASRLRSADTHSAQVPSSSSLPSSDDTRLSNSRVPNVRRDP